MNKLKFSDPKLFKSAIPSDEIVGKFIATDGVFADTNNIVLSLNRKYCNPHALSNLLEKEFRFLNDSDSATNCDSENFKKIEEEQAFVDFLAITLVSEKYISGKSSLDYGGNISVTPEGVLFIVCDSENLTIPDYCRSIREFLNQVSWPLHEQNLRFELTLSLSECAQLMRDK